MSLSLYFQMGLGQLGTGKVVLVYCESLAIKTNCTRTKKIEKISTFPQKLFCPA